MRMPISPANEARDRKIAALAKAHVTGRSLAQALYADPDVFERDLERIFLRHWLCVDHESSLARPGDFRLFELASESIIIARGADGVLRAFANVCRHRGSRVCSTPSGNAKYFICPYHAWTYGLDGSLHAARHMPQDFDAARHGLKEINLRIVEGLVFVSFAASPLGLDEVEATLASFLRPFDWAGARVAHRESYAIEANWKLAVENYLECYHCAPAHPEYSKLHALEQPLARIEALNARMRERSSALGLDFPDHDHWVASASGAEAVFGFRYALYDGIETGSADGRAVAPLMGRFTAYDGGATSIHFGPASFFLAYADHGVIYRFIPKSAQGCEMEIIWLVAATAREGADYDLDRLTWLWKVTSEADKRIIEQNQLGVNSRFYEPGPYAPMEYNTRRYVDWYLREIA
jgi:phenylpropionate dioxygenase-like ring-hydroxylating dioxygenase large terminal subunit